MTGADEVWRMIADWTNCTLSHSALGRLLAAVVEDALAIIATGRQNGMLLASTRKGGVALRSTNKW